MTPILIEQYWMGRDKLYPEEWTDEIRENGIKTVEKVNELLKLWGGYTQVTSGWRPPQINAATVGSAKHSNHMAALACDLLDKSGVLDQWCMDNQKMLEDIGLWQEFPNEIAGVTAGTPGWCHLQTVPPKSGHRVFIA